MRVLVTGSSGFLGRHLCRELSIRNYGVDKVTSKGEIGLLHDTMFDVIFHLAAYTQAGDWCLTHSGEQWITNQKINTRILEFWKEKQPQAKLITIGSSCAYAPGSNLREEDYMRGEPHESLYTYAMTKRMLYEGCRALNKQYGMKYLYLVPSTLYGPDYHRDGRQAHFIFDLIRKIIRGKELGEPIVLWGNGQQLREVIYVEDFIRLMLDLNDKAENDIFNVGASAAVTIAGCANTICDIAGYNVSKIIYDRDKYMGASEKTLCMEKTNKFLGRKRDNMIGKYNDETPLDGGIKKTMEWYYETGAWK